MNCSVARQCGGPWCWLLVGPQHMDKGHARIGSGLPKFVQTSGSSFKNTQFLFKQCFFHPLVTSGILKTTTARKRRWNITERLGAVVNAIFRYTYYNIRIKGQWSDLLHAHGEQKCTSTMMMNGVRKYKTTIPQGLNLRLWGSAQSYHPPHTCLDICLILVPGLLASWHCCPHHECSLAAPT